MLAVASSAVREPIPGIQLSNAHRPGLLAAFKVLAKRVAADGVTLNTVLPGQIATDRAFANAGSREAAEDAARDSVPAGRLGTVEEMAAAAVFLCSAPASYITGTTLLVDGGLTASVSRAARTRLPHEHGPLAQLAEQGTSGRSASRETASTSAAICWNPLRALGTGQPVKIPVDWAISRQPRGAGEPSEAIRRPP